MAEKPNCPDPAVREVIERVFEGRSIPIQRRIILQHYLNSVVGHIKWEGSNVSHEALRQAVDRGLEDYSKENIDKIYENPIKQLEAAENELASLKEKQASYQALADKHASRMLFLAFSNCAL